MIQGSQMIKKISTITIITSIAISIFFTAVIIWNLNTMFSRFKNLSLAEMESAYISQQKDLLKTELKHVIDDIYDIKTRTYAAEKSDMAEQSDIAEHLLLDIQKNENRKFTEKDFLNVVDSLGWSEESRQYMTLSTSGSVVTSTAGDKSLRTDLSKNTARAVRDGFAYTVKTLENTSGKVKSEKLLFYLKYSPELDTVIAVSSSLRVLTKKMQKAVIDSVSSYRYGHNNYGYFWIIDTDYNTVFHIQDQMYNEDLYSLQDPKGSYIFRDFVSMAKTNGAGFSEYFWTLPDRNQPSRKISYMEYIPEWNWIIGTGFYFENFYKMASDQQKMNESLLQKAINENIFIISLLFVGILIASFVIYRKIRKVEEQKDTNMNDLLQYKNVLESSFIVSITDVEGIITYVNDEFCRITGFDSETLIGKKHNLLKHPDNPQITYTELWNTIKKGEIWKGIIKNITANGGYFYHKLTITPFKDKTGKIISYVSSSHDVTEVFENKTKLQKYLNLDQLTELGNRTSLLMALQSTKSADIALVDIDNFHIINETYGMKTGDDILVDFAKRLLNSDSIKNYELFRLHSDVFAIMSYMSDRKNFWSNVEKAVSSISNSPFYTGSHEVLIRTKIGYAHDSKIILAHADSALQFAKANNLDSHVFDPGKTALSEVYEKNTQVIKLVSKAIEEDRVIPFFQPIRHSENSDVKYECLMRIEGSDGEIISPSEFLEISKQTRLYPQLTKIIAKKSIDTFAGKGISFSINLSSHDILDSATMKFIYDYAEKKNVLNHLILEIVESDSISSSPVILEMLNMFKEAGTRLAIDDFGTGYSNFEYLLKIKADFVKIDGSIIKLITNDDRATDVVKSIVSYARKLGMQTVAEFISSKAVEQKALELGVDYLQGYHIGKPSRYSKAEYLKAV